MELCGIEEDEKGVRSWGFDGGEDIKGYWRKENDDEEEENGLFGNKDSRSSIKWNKKFMGILVILSD